MRINIEDLQDQEKMKFLMKIKSCVDGIELQRSRVKDASDTRAVHDAGYYMILLRRLYREIETFSRCDSRVANLKSKNIDLCQKIKMREDFEHYAKKDDLLDKDILVDLGIISQEFAGNIEIQTSVFKKGNSLSIISGDIQWDMTQDHQAFLEMINQFIELYPFKMELISNHITYKQLLDENKKLNTIIETQKQEINSLKQAPSSI